MTNLVFEKYSEDQLFKDCIELSCPDGYIKVFDEIYEVVKSFNEKHKINVVFGQVKIKFGRLVVYLQPLIDNSDANIYDSPISIDYDVLIKKIEIMCKKTGQMCVVCGKKTSTIVIDTRIIEKCFDHYDTNQGR
tara:strand:+ start:523 stop:924 length:402 start_codon:yes stop_codon:yes gene_type:complete